MTRNSITGSFPSTIGSVMRKLVYLDLSNNRFTNQIPTSLGLIRSLTLISLSKNSFSKSLPSSFGQIVKLKYLDVGLNNLQGSVPDSLCNITSITWLNAGGNTNLHCYAPCLSSLSTAVATFGIAHPCSNGKYSPLSCLDIRIALFVIGVAVRRISLSP